MKFGVILTGGPVHEQVDNAAIRQMLGRERLPQFVGSIDRKAPYRPDH